MKSWFWKVLKKSVKSALIAVLVMVLGAFGALVADRYAIPKFANSLADSRFAFLKRATETTTIINKTEQVVIREDDSVEKLALQASTAAVKIISRPETSEKSLGARVTENTSLIGSGVLVTNDGLIVTYRKAILEKNTKYSAILFNGSSYDATLVGIDPLTNLAYLRIDADNVPAIAFSNSDDARAGKKLVALAMSPQENRARFSLALLNDINKTLNLAEMSVASSEKWEGAFVADFANQKDYVGGPVINYGGEMVGMVAYTEFDGKRSYFVLPSNVIRDSLSLALQNNLDTRPTLGLSYLPITREMSVAYRLPSERGALVFSHSGRSGLAVLADSPAEKAKILINDIVLAVDDQEIDLDHPLPMLIGRHKKGDVIQLTVLRGDKKLTLPVGL